MRSRGVREGLVKRCEGILRETINRVRVGEEEGREFWTVMGVRQGCPASSSLFTVMLADMEEELRKGGWGGVKLAGRKVYSLAYAHDVAIVAEDEKCIKGGGRWRKIKMWKGMKVEEVREFKYLEYIK